VAGRQGWFLRRLSAHMIPQIMPVNDQYGVPVHSWDKDRRLLISREVGCGKVCPTGTQKVRQKCARVWS
jgi:hypothetical protein